MNSNKIRTYWNEQWVPVITNFPTKNHDYEISNYGRIKSILKETGDEVLLKGSKMVGGLCSLNLKLTNNKVQAVYLHKFVAEHFVENDDPAKTFVIHLDANKNNNHWQNLKWVTQAELTQWQIKTGVYSPENRKKSSHAKLTETKVRLIKERLRKGKTKRKIIAKNFDISVTLLNRIEKGESWKHVS